MANVSTVPAVKGAILGLIEARGALAAIQTEWGHPGKNIARESIFMEDAQFDSESIAFMRVAPHPHTEEYVVPVVVDVLSEGDDARAAEERGWTLAGEVEEAIRNATNLGLPGVVIKSWVSGKTPIGYQSDMGRAFRCLVNVSVQARSQ